MTWCTRGWSLLGKREKAATLASTPVRKGFLRRGSLDNGSPERGQPSVRLNRERCGARGVGEEKGPPTALGPF
jgi:hypothetical protein